LLVPIPFALWKWLETRNTIYSLSDQRLKFTRGVLTKTTEDLELYRVQVRAEPFERLVGLGKSRCSPP
jgi:uncharacterized membrane protein YdbT with pleckstrin-like domain